MHGLLDEARPGCARRHRVAEVVVGEGGNLVLEAEGAFLRKPFSPAELLNKVRESLEGSEA